MPASYCHQSVASQALACLGRNLTPSCLAACLAGAEGPDPLFYGFYRSNPPGASIAAGSMLHREQTDRFLCALQINARSSIECSYADGFLTHYAADTVFHPYVYGHSVTEKGTYSANLHGIIEHAYEIIRFRRDGNPTGIPIQLAGLSQLGLSDLKACLRLFAVSMHEVFPDRSIGETELLHIFQAAIRVAGWLRSPSGRKYRIFGAAPFQLDKTAHAHMVPPEPPPGDLWNDEHREWSSIFEPETIRRESMDDLYQAAVARSCELLKAASHHRAGHLTEREFADILGGLSYDSGLPWQHTPEPRNAPGIAIHADRARAFKA